VWESLSPWGTESGRFLPIDHNGDPSVLLSFEPKPVW